MEKYDFSGWATRNDLRCSDGLTIKKDAFKHNDGANVPLVWNHQHDHVQNILGHAILENREEGVYAYCSFNDTASGKEAKELVKHGDVEALSIWANKLKKNGSDVLHGSIKEVSLVLAGANPGATIEEVLYHGEYSEDEAIISIHEPLEIFHSEESKKPEELKPADPKEDSSMPENKEKTVAEVFDTLSEEQKTVVYAMIGAALDEASGGQMQQYDYDEEGEYMKHNIFDQNYEDDRNELIHADIEAAFSDAKRIGSMKEAFIAHGITDIDYLFPDATTLNNTPDFIKRDTGWVGKVMAATHHSPFSRIKSIHANLTEEEARAKGYITGNLKVEEVISLLKRSTLPQTIYKKQKLDRDDIIDITDFDVVAWLKGEMRIMLDEEIARAVLVGDGRLVSSDDKILETNVRPIWTDDDLYTIKQVYHVAKDSTEDDDAKAFIRNCVKSRKLYKGSGNPTLFTTEDVLTNCLLMEDSMGRIIYETQEKLATALRVKEIITVPVMESLSRVDGDTLTRHLDGIIVNLADYNIGADKGGAVNMFDDFDIDYNQQKYLIETRCSGAMTKPYGAIALERIVDTV